MKSTNSPVVAMSSCESEYISTTLTIKRIIHLQYLLSDLGEKQDTTTVYTDNKANLDLSYNDRISARSAHIDSQFHFTKEKVKDGKVNMKFLPTEAMPSDLQTKSLDKTRHETHTRIVQNLSGDFIRKPTEVEKVSNV